jgi:hypothetical protein
MIRTYLAKGDRAGEAVIIEGLPTSIYQGNDGHCVELATVYMQTYCRACKQSGLIAPSGPRLGSRAENGKEHALSGDVNICGCQPPPIFWAQRNMTETITSADIARMNVPFADSRYGSSDRQEFNEKFVLLDESGIPAAFRIYAVERETGTIEHGVSDAQGHTHVLVQTQTAERVRIYVESIE